MFMWSCRPKFHFLDVNMEGSSLRRGQASTCQDAWWLTWSQLSPRCVWAKHFLVCFRVPLDLVLLTFDWEHTACPCFPCLHWTTDFSPHWVLETRWLMKFALVRTASCSILSNWFRAKKTLLTILHAGTTPSEKRLWILSWTGSASWQTIALVTPLRFGYNFGLKFSCELQCFKHHICKKIKVWNIYSFHFFQCTVLFLSRCAWFCALVTSRSPRFARVLCVQRLRWWHWIRSGLPYVGAFVCGLRQEEQDLFHSVVLPTSSDRSGRAL